MISKEQQAMLAEIRTAIDAFERDEVVQGRYRASGKPYRCSDPSWNFLRYEYTPVPTPEFVWPAGVNADQIRKREDGWLEFRFHCSPDVVCSANVLKGDIVRAMEVGTWYRNPDGQEKRSTRREC